MTTRRRILRTTVAPDPGATRRQKRIARLEHELVKERQALQRSMARLNRVCGAIDRQRKRIVRLDKTLDALQPPTSPS